MSLHLILLLYHAALVWAVTMTCTLHQILTPQNRHLLAHAHVCCSCMVAVACCLGPIACCIGQLHPAWGHLHAHQPEGFALGALPSVTAVKSPLACQQLTGFLVGCVQVEVAIRSHMAPGFDSRSVQQWNRHCRIIGALLQHSQGLQFSGWGRRHNVVESADTFKVLCHCSSRQGKLKRAAHCATQHWQSKQSPI